MTEDDRPTCPDHGVYAGPECWQCRAYATIRKTYDDTTARAEARRAADEAFAAATPALRRIAAAYNAEASATEYVPAFVEVLIADTDGGALLRLIRALDALET